MDFELLTDGGDRYVIVRISGECDAGNAAALREFLLDVLTGESARILLDLSRLDFLDCAGARALTAVSRRAGLLGDRGGQAAAGSPPSNWRSGCRPPAEAATTTTSRPGGMTGPCPARGRLHRNRRHR